MEKLNIKNNEIIEIGNNRAKLKIHKEKPLMAYYQGGNSEEYGLMSALLKDGYKFFDGCR